MKAVTRTDSSNPSQSLIKSICYPFDNKFESDATKWGHKHEDNAIQSLICKFEEDGHENVVVEQCGLFVSEDQPFIAATPDGIISCDCCGKQLVEVKCPFSIKDEKLYENENFYLKKDHDGEFRLDREHEYFFQVQTQMGVTQIESCLFVVWTTQDVHIEQILFDQAMWQEMCFTAEHFFYTALLPELVGKFYTRLPHSGLSSPLQPVASTPLQPLASTSMENTGKCNDEERWCYCDQVEFGDMVCCDNENCDIKWFHFECLKLKSNPKKKEMVLPRLQKIARVHAQTI